MSNAMDETVDMWNGNGEDACVKSQCEEDEDTVKMETMTLIGRGR